MTRLLTALIASLVIGGMSATPATARPLRDRNGTVEPVASCARIVITLKHAGDCTRPLRCQRLHPKRRTHHALCAVRLEQR